MSSQDSEDIDQDISNQEAESNEFVEEEYDDAQAEEQVNNFYEQAVQDEIREADEFDYYCQRHQLGFDDYERYASHMIKHDKIIAYSLGIAKKFCKYCWRLFRTPQKRNTHQIHCRLCRNPLNHQLNNRQRQRLDLQNQLCFNIQ